VLAWDGRQRERLGRGTRWRASGSPYIVTNDITVAAGSTLTVDRGVRPGGTGAFLPDPGTLDAAVLKPSPFSSREAHVTKVGRAAIRGSLRARHAQVLYDHEDRGGGRGAAGRERSFGAARERGLVDLGARQSRRSGRVRSSSSSTPRSRTYRGRELHRLPRSARAPPDPAVFDRCRVHSDRRRCRTPPIVRQCVIDDGSGDGDSPE